MHAVHAGSGCGVQVRCLAIIAWFPQKDTIFELTLESGCVAVTSLIFRFICPKSCTIIVVWNCGLWMAGVTIYWNCTKMTPRVKCESPTITKRQNIWKLIASCMLVGFRVLLLLCHAVLPVNWEAYTWLVASITKVHFETKCKHFNPICASNRQQHQQHKELKRNKTINFFRARSFWFSISCAQ